MQIILSGCEDGTWGRTLRSLLRAGLTIAVVFGVSVWSAETRAQSLPDLLLNLIENHDRINGCPEDANLDGVIRGFIEDFLSSS